MAKKKVTPTKEVESLSLEKAMTEKEIEEFQQKLNNIDKIDIDSIVDEISESTGAPLEQDMALTKGMAFFLKKSLALDSAQNEELYDIRADIASELNVDEGDFGVALTKYDTLRGKIETKYKNEKEDNEVIKKFVIALLSTQPEKDYELKLPIGSIKASTTQILEIMTNCEGKVADSLFSENTSTAIRVALESYPKLNELILHCLNLGLKVDPLGYTISNKFKIATKATKEKK